MTENNLFGNKGLSCVIHMKVESICESSTDLKLIRLGHNDLAGTALHHYCWKRSSTQ